MNLYIYIWINIWKIVLSQNPLSLIINLLKFKIKEKGIFICDENLLYYFLRVLAWAKALPAIDLVRELDRPSFNALEALEATLLDVVFLLDDFLAIF